MDNYNDQHHGEEDFYKNTNNQKVQPKSLWKRHPWIVVSIALGILLIIFASSTFYLLASKTTTPTTAVDLRVATVSPTPTQAVTPPVDTLLPTVTTTTDTPSALATVVAGTFTEPDGGLKLHTNSDDAVTVTITSMKYDPANNRMLWYLTLKNVASTSTHVYSGTLSLQSDAAGDTDNKHQADLINDQVDIEANTQVQESSTFTFVPYQKTSGVTYTLTASINTSQNFISLTFDPVTITF